MTAAAATTRPGALRRASAALALLALLVTLLYVVVATLGRWDVLLATTVSLAVAIVAAWYALSRRGVVRVVAGVVLVLALATFVAVMIGSQSVRVVALALVLSAVSVAATTYALTPAPRTDLAEPAPVAQRAVLFMNPRSGGGKVERFNLVELCKERNVAPRVLQPGDDLRAVAEDAVAAGADLLGMAGGDGSLAIVASVASRHGIPFVVVPAGTRNHFALDLGIDRSDVPGSLAAYVDGVDVQVDLARVNDVTFVNNASMGVYAKIVQSEEYRDAKVRTAADMLPDLLGPETEPLELHYRLPSGDEVPPGQLLLVSNNRYALDRLSSRGTRESLTDGLLGVVSLRVASATDAQKVAALDVTGRLRRFAGYHEWTASEFVVESGQPVEIGVDGEALTLDPPLRFVIQPGAVTVRLPRSALSRWETSRVPRVTAPETLAALWRLVLDRPRRRR